MNRGRLIAIAALSLAGAGVATYLTSIHVRHLSTGAASSCNFGGAFNFAALTCSSVNRSVVDPNYRHPSMGLRICASWPLRRPERGRDPGKGGRGL